MDADSIIEGIAKKAWIEDEPMWRVRIAARLAYVAGMREAAMVARSYGRLDTATAIASAADAIERGE